MSLLRRSLLLVACGIVLGGEVPSARAEEAPSPPAAARTSRVQGSALLGRNRPVIGASVVVQPTSRGGELYLTATDAKGSFRIEGLADGTYALEIRQEGLEPVKKEKIGVRFPFRAIVEVTMAPSSQASAAPAPMPPTPSAAQGALDVEGVATGLDGSAVADLVVRFTRTDAAVDPREVRTGRDGTFRIGALPAGTWQIESRGLAYLPMRATVDLEAATHVGLVLVPQPTIYEPPADDLLPREEAIPPRG